MRVILYHLAPDQAFILHVTHDAKTSESPLPFLCLVTPTLQYLAQIASSLSCTARVCASFPFAPKALGPSLYDHMDHSLSLRTLQWVLTPLEQKGGLLYSCLCAPQHPRRSSVDINL